MLGGLGDDPEVRYSVLAPTIAGLIAVAVRLLDSDGNARANGKLIRWPKLLVSELAIEASGGRRMVGVQVENIVLKGIDAEADRVCEFVRTLIAGIDDRKPVPVPIAVVREAAEAGAVVEKDGWTSASVHRPQQSGCAEPGTDAHNRGLALVPAAESASPPVAPVAPPRPPGGPTPENQEPEPVPEAELESVRSEWVGPHPTEELPDRDPKPPRPGMP